jgi:DNA repair ATPase RecN
VLLGLGLSIALVRYKLWSQPWMAPALYGWQLKRKLLRITNQMHRLKAAVAAGDAQAMQLLRFYHLGVSQMQQLDGNTSDLSQMRREVDQHREAMEQAGLDVQQERFNPAWLERLKQFSG